MGKRRPDDDDDGGLDSLLDTMTNVVGILVLVLIVTQMSVADMVTRITSENQIDEESIAELTQQLEIAQAEKTDLESVLVDPLNIDPEQQREELERKKELLERRKSLLAEKEKQKNEFAMKVQSDREMAEKNQKDIEDTAKKRQELETVLASAMEKRASLQAMLASTPKTEAPADIEVSIPNPRPAPPGAKQLLILCVDNRVYPVADEVFRKVAEQKMKALIARFKLDRDPVAGIDPKKFTQYWERFKEQDEFFDVEYYVTNDRFPRLRFKPREGRGANEKELLNPRSRIRSEKWLGSLDITKTYARFFVFPDSFDVYVTARRFFSESGMLAGWEPQPEKYEYTTYVPGGIELGPPRKKVPPKPAAPRKPANLID